MREGFRGDEAALKALDDAEEYYHSTVGIAHDPFITQISRIPSTDVIPAMLGESSEIIRKTMSIIGQDKVELVFKEACDLIERVLAEGEVIPLADEKLKAIKGG
jgi:hypothetical protein